MWKFRQMRSFLTQYYIGQLYMLVYKTIEN